MRWRVNCVEVDHGNRIGYRQMHQRLLVVQKEFVRVIMKDQDPVGVELPSSRRLGRLRRS